MIANERTKVSTETLREPTRPAKPDRQPEASLGWRPETAPSSVGSELQSRVIEPRNGLYLWSLRCRKYVGSTEAPLRSGVEVRPGPESRAEQYRVSRETGRASCLLGSNRERTNPVNQGPEPRPTPPRSAGGENSRGAEVSRTERQSEGAETNRGSLSRRIVALETGVTDPREPGSSEGSGRDADVSLATRAGPVPAFTCATENDP